MTLDEAERLEEIIATLGEVRGKLYPKAREFLDDVTKRFEEKGADMYMSERQWSWLNDIAEQFT